MSTDPNSSDHTELTATARERQEIYMESPPVPPKRKRHWAVWAAALLILCGGTFLLSQRTSSAPSGNAGGGAKSGKKGRNAGPTPVAVGKVTQGDIGEYINALGIVTPVYTVTVASRVVGQLMDVRYREGQMVHKGQVLATVDPRPYQAVVTQAEGQLARDQALLKNAYIDLDRYKLVYAQHAIPEQTLATQQATVEQDQGTVKVDQGTLDAAKVNLDYANITSPIDGRVGLRTVDPGNIVQANGTTGIATITQLQPITVVFSVAEDYLGEVTGQMRTGHKLRVDALDRAQQAEIAQGSVLTVDNQVDTTTGTVRVKALFSNRDNHLFPNEFVNAKLLVRTLSNVNLIPTAAIQRNNDVAFVYVVQPDNTVKSRNIKVATTNGNSTAVTGVKPGETLVVDGFDRLQEGGHVSVRKDSDTPTGRTPKPDTGNGAQEGRADRQPNAQEQQQSKEPTNQTQPSSRHR